jgi:hypothetical protein
MSIPIIFDKPIYVWGGIILLFVLAIQVYSGYMITHGKPKYVKVHKINSLILIVLALGHALAGLAVWFFNAPVR